MTVTDAEHALSVRQILALERIAAGDPEVVAGAATSTGPCAGCTSPRPPTSG